MSRVFLSETAVVSSSDQPVDGALVHRDGRDWYEIGHYDHLPPFLVSLVSSSDHWWYVSSSGGMTAGRADADHAFLPYDTEDKIAWGVGTTGPLTVLRVLEGEGAHLWEPLRFDGPRVHRLERRLRKSVEGDAMCFEETNLDLGLRFEMTLRYGEQVGFVRTVAIHDTAGRERRLDVLDGYRNVLPAGATRTLQTRMSSLLDAYKRSERDPVTGVVFFSLSSTLTDRAEASEALRANVLWSSGLEPDGVLLTPDERVDAFRRGEPIEGDTDVRGHRAAYLAFASKTIEPHGAARWHTVAEVACDAKAAGTIRTWQRDLDAAGREALLERDIAAGTRELRRIVGRADGMSVSGDRLTTTHHFANTLFNVMRGGVFVDGHSVETRDLAGFVATRNAKARRDHGAWLSELPAKLPIGELLAKADAVGDVDLQRLVLEYLPLTFSRRHGDPSRPWNQFAIRLRNDDGTPRTDYQGNWRDIFQNWEPLAFAYPAFAFSMVAKFLNATTLDGYNPYRVTRDGIEWEVPEPDDPWSNLGYWGDHQIIYLQKLLEAVEQLEPGRLAREWRRRRFSYADVPYRLATYEDTVRDWSDTVAFDDAAHERTEQRAATMGTDGRLVPAPDDASAVHHVPMIEKLLVLLLAKLTNLVPGGGIWMNTQRPEWNDANNALVGKGVSVVTAAYLRRFLAFFRNQLASVDEAPFAVSSQVAELAGAVRASLDEHRAVLREGALDDASRRRVMDALGEAGTAYRAAVYAGVSADTRDVSREQLDELLEVALAYVDHALGANLRDDGLYNAYLVLRFSEGEAAVDALDLMLEGQVAILSSGVLSPEQSLAMLRAMPESRIYWPEQHTYLLYPNKALPGFLQKNTFSAERAQRSALVRALGDAGDDRLVVIDPYDGAAHFGGDLRNAEELSVLLDELARDTRYEAMVAAEREDLLALFEEVFDHASFTGRSGAFFAYEGLGSVYWHMVSKLLLAAQECFFVAVDRDAPAEVVSGLANAYYDVRAGLGFQKSPADFGAFPTDPYSHTPETGRARQPGMTGLVKEEILARMGELGVRVWAGELRFEPHLLRASERLEAPAALHYCDTNGELAERSVPAGALGFTFAQTPVIVELTEGPTRVTVHMADGTEHAIEGGAIPAELAAHVFARDGAVREIRVSTAAGRD